MKNKRAMERFSLQFEAEIHSINGFVLSPPIKARTKDISSAGVFIYTENVQPVGIKVGIDIYLPIKKLKVTEKASTILRISGTITRVETTGMAVRIMSHNYI